MNNYCTNSRKRIGKMSAHLLVLYNVFLHGRNINKFALEMEDQMFEKKE